MNHTLIRMDGAAVGNGLIPQHVGSQKNELIVALEHADLTVQQMGEPEIGVQAQVADTSKELGLARLRWSGHVDPGQHEPGAGDPDVSRWNPNDQDGIVLALLKRAFRQRFGGWVPTMGRNRLVGHVDGTNGVIVLSGNEPQWTDPQAFSISSEPGDAPPPGGAVRVGVVDTPLRPHPELEGRWIAPYPASYGPEDVDAAGNVSYRAGHATFVSGLVLQRASRAMVLGDGVLDHDAASTSWETAKAIVRTARSGVDLVNLSFACYTPDGVAPLVLSTAISRLPADTLVIAAAGNYANRTDPVVADTGESVVLATSPTWPAALDDVVAVGAIETNGNPASFSPQAPWVDVATTGVDVPGPLSAYRDGAARTGTATWTGTSFATARMTGEIAARVIPGDVTPRAAWQALIQELADAGHPRVLL